MAELNQLTSAVARDLRAKPKGEAPPLIVWPEAAAPFIYAEQPRWRQRMRETAQGAGAYLLFGSLGVDRNGERPRLLNSAYLAPPYQVSAIGPTDLLEQLGLSRGWMEFVDTRVGTFGLRISYAEPEVVEVPEFAGSIVLRRSRAVPRSPSAAP